MFGMSQAMHVHLGGGGVHEHCNLTAMGLFYLVVWSLISYID